jgi:hypothetical protein
MTDPNPIYTELVAEQEAGDVTRTQGDDEPQQDEQMTG